MTRFITASLALALLAGCSSPCAVTPATAEQRALLLDRMKSLAGTWESAKPMEGDHGPGITTFSVTSDGSVVREIMFPSSPKEMTNMYSMDGPTLVMTHYCSMGNQPRMRASAESHNQIALKCDGVGNLTGGEYMGGLTIVFKDANTIEERWTMFKDGKSQGEHIMEFKRKA